MKLFWLYGFVNISKVEILLYITDGIPKSQFNWGGRWLKSWFKDKKVLLLILTWRVYWRIYIYLYFMASLCPIVFLFLSDWTGSISASSGVFWNYESSPNPFFFFFRVIWILWQGQLNQICQYINPQKKIGKAGLSGEVRKICSRKGTVSFLLFCLGLIRKGW